MRYEILPWFRSLAPLEWAVLFALVVLALVPLASLVLPNLLAPVGRSISQVIDAISGVTLWIAIGSGVLLVAWIIADTLLAHVFTFASVAFTEAALYLFALGFLIATMSALRDDAHVRVDILRGRMGSRVRSWIDLAGIYLFLFPMMGLIIMGARRSVYQAWAIREASGQSGGLPLQFLFETLVPGFAFLLILQGISQAWKAACDLRARAG